MFTLRNDKMKFRGVFTILSFLSTGQGARMKRSEYEFMLVSSTQSLGKMFCPVLDFRAEPPKKDVSVTNHFQSQLETENVKLWHWWLLSRSCSRSGGSECCCWSCTTAPPCSSQEILNATSAVSQQRRTNCREFNRNQLFAGVSSIM